MEWSMVKQRLMGYAESFSELSRVYYMAGPEGQYQTELVGEKSMNRQQLLEEQKLKESRLAVGETMDALAGIMADIAEEMGTYYPVEEKKKRLIMQVLKGEGFYIDNLYYLPGDGKKTMLGMSLSTDKKGGRPAKAVADILSVIYKKQIRLCVSSSNRVEKEAQWFVFVEEATYMVLTGFAKATKEEESVSGDHYAIVESEKGKLTLILSDGTGSGERAGENSGRVLDLMEKFMETGYDAGGAVRIVNTAYYAMEEEGNHPTMDICELDLYDGHCDICKVGGAATFIKHGEAVEQISESVLPLGILQSIDTKTVHRKLQSGDYVIMMTDGVLDVLADYEEKQVLSMAEMISSLSQINAEEMAQELLRQVLQLSGGRIKDDMTILVAGIWENSIIS